MLGLLPAGCGSGASSGFAGEVGTYEPDGGLVLGSGDASAPGALDAHIEQNHITVTFVTLSCTGPCADVVAVPTGGNAPYTFKWDDGSTSASRHVCPTASTSYAVTVTDTGVTGELARAAQSVRVPLEANVIACPDGGVTDAGPGATDGPVDPSCSAVTVGTAPASCTSPSGGILSPLGTGALIANAATTIRVTGTGSFTAGQGWNYEVWGSPDGCTLDELLGKFQLYNGPLDVNVCVTPTRANAHAVLFYRFTSMDALSLSTWSVSQCGGCTVGDR
jgi:hypothetical protein